VLAATGLAILGYIAWEYVGTNVVAHHRQAEQIAELRRTWHEPGGADAESGGIPLGAASALVRIPRFGDDYVMPVVEGTGDSALAEGIGHFTSSAGPGQRGNYALAAHRITHGQPFAELPTLRVGDVVLVETRTRVYTYVIDTDPNDLIVDDTASWVIDPTPQNPQANGVEPDSIGSDRILTLTTCAELFHTDDRMVAFGHLVSSSAKHPE
jgi:sortase A